MGVGWGAGNGSGGDASEGERRGAMGSHGERRGATGSDGEPWGAMGSEGERQTKLRSLARCSPPAVRPSS